MGHFLSSHVLSVLLRGTLAVNLTEEVQEGCASGEIPIWGTNFPQGEGRLGSVKTKYRM